jgi:hypothetical protein
VTDAGLPHLKKFPQLRYVDLHWQQASEAAIKELEKAMPNLDVWNGNRTTSGRSK